MNKRSPVYSENIEKQPPHTLFHYTTPNGLLGIVDSKELWATDIRYLNDSKEFEHAIDLLFEINREIVRGSGEHPLKPFRVESELMAEIDILTSRKWDHQVYVVSFSEVGDLLSQWRGYCPKGGYSIGFSSIRLRNLAQKFDSELKPCVYDSSLKKSILEELLYFYNRMFLRLLGKTKAFNRKQLVRIIGTRFVLKLFSIAPLLKDSSFQEEREWRIVSARLRSQPRKFYRASDASIVPYIKFLLGDNLVEWKIRQIICGPNSNSESSKRAVEGLFREFRIPDTSFRLSKIPYRTSR